ncbi:flavodoxin domain-containing protein, partial [Providencia rettgeri]
GALFYPRYKWFDRTMIRLIMKMTDGPTDPNTEIEYTNWENVTQFASEFDKL